MLNEPVEPLEMIFHVCRADEWAAAKANGDYSGSSQDRIDGFIHFSDFNQVRASVAKHRAGQDNLVILGVDPARLPVGDLKWELSRGGVLFPHLYGDLPVSAVVRTDDLRLMGGSVHAFPDDIGVEG